MLMRQLEVLLLLAEGVALSHKFLYHYITEGTWTELTGVALSIMFTFGMLLLFHIFISSFALSVFIIVTLFFLTTKTSLTLIVSHLTVIF